LPVIGEPPRPAEDSTPHNRAKSKAPLPQKHPVDTWFFYGINRRRELQLGAEGRRRSRYEQPTLNLTPLVGWRRNLPLENAVARMPMAPV